jgi:hypothetical protein
MHSEIHLSASPIFVKSATLSMRKDAWVLWIQLARTPCPYKQPPSLITLHPYRSSVALYLVSLPQRLQTSQRERRGPLLKSFAACAYKVIRIRFPLARLIYIILKLCNRYVTREVDAHRYDHDSIGLSHRRSGTPSHRNQYLSVLSTKFAAPIDFWPKSYQQSIFFPIS